MPLKPCQTCGHGVAYGTLDKIACPNCGETNPHPVKMFSKDPVAIMMWGVFGTMLLFVLVCMGLGSR